MVFREAMGLFWNDRYKAVAEAVINLVVSLLLVKPYGVNGIVGGTIISSLTTCVWAEPYVVMKYGVRDGWRTKLKDYFVEYGKRVCIVAVLSALAARWVQRFPVHNFGGFILDGVLYTAVFAVVIFGIYHKTESFAALWNRGRNMIRRRQEKMD